MNDLLPDTCERCGRRFSAALAHGGLVVSPLLCTPCLFDDDE